MMCVRISQFYTTYLPDLLNSTPDSSSSKKLFFHIHSHTAFAIGTWAVGRQKNTAMLLSKTETSGSMIID